MSRDYEVNSSAVLFESSDEEVTEKMSRYYDVTSEAALFESDEDEQMNNEKTKMKPFDPFSSRNKNCERLTFDRIEHEIPNRSLTRTLRQVPVKDPNLRIPVAFEQYMENRLSSVATSHNDVLELPYDYEPNHIVEKDLHIPSNYITTHDCCYNTKDKMETSSKAAPQHYNLLGLPCDRKPNHIVKEAYGLPFHDVTNEHNLSIEQKKLEDYLSEANQRHYDLYRLPKQIVEKIPCLPDPSDNSVIRAMQERSFIVEPKPRVNYLSRATPRTYNLLAPIVNNKHREPKPMVEPVSISPIPFDDITNNEDFINKTKQNADITEKRNINLDKAGCSSQTIEKTDSSNKTISAYKINNRYVNRMIIFNHENFTDNAPRVGTAVDVASLIKTFEKLRFHVTVCKDLDEAELFSTLKTFSGQDFSACGCVCVAVLTHGSDHGFLAACDEWYSERRLLASFSALANRTLVHKPIIFLIQACRGQNLARPVPIPEPEETSTLELDSGKISNGGPSVPAEANMIIFHSTFSGRASVRDRGAGSWFIQTLCQQLELFAAREDVERIFLRVRDIVASKEAAGGGKQMPITYSALTKKLFLK